MRAPYRSRHLRREHGTTLLPSTTTIQRTTLCFMTHSRLTVCASRLTSRITRFSLAATTSSRTPSNSTATAFLPLSAFTWTKCRSVTSDCRLIWGEQKKGHEHNKACVPYLCRCAPNRVNATGPSLRSVFRLAALTPPKRLKLGAQVGLVHFHEITRNGGRPWGPLWRPGALECRSQAGRRPRESTL